MHGGLAGIQPGAHGNSRKKLRAAVGALYFKRPTADQLAGTGLKPKHYPEPIVTVWPENWEVIQLFSRVSTQWRVGPGGPIGLDYTVIYRELDRSGVSGADFETTMAALRVIEAAALDEIHKD